ncbi:MULTISPECIES: hypothetical protein [Methanobacterium]|uniref:Uncharacterized protein n=1 Tax=Methanobacterium veterum TaxID=408577 RepID=A0A9E5DQK6_9EURY|nr:MULTISPECIES: hypothetical protein [Methanobacterium]MCZ3373603.1 hypothetical protein [Methanobacterium veterum]
MSLVVIAGVGIGSTAAQNITIGSGASVLDPSQNQTQDQAQAETQTQSSANNNTLNNSNNNTAISTANAINNISIINTNTFNPFIYLTSENRIGDISVCSSNINAQLKAEGLRYVPFDGAYGTGNVPELMASTPNKSSSTNPSGVGMQESGLNVTSLLMGIVGVLGGLLASRYSS